MRRYVAALSTELFRRVMTEAGFEPATCRLRVEVTLSGASDNLGRTRFRPAGLGVFLCLCPYSHDREGGNRAEVWQYELLSRILRALAEAWLLQKARRKARGQAALLPRRTLHCRKSNVQHTFLLIGYFRCIKVNVELPICSVSLNFGSYVAFSST